ncbi:hypothetical protein [Sphingobium lactosutens]|nr:hypothetical protein [Sphingobium lactosutens]MCC4257001.1 hypothetical protein [Sphingobium lactosutens]
MLAKIASVGLVTVKSDILDVADQTASVRVKIINRVAEPEQPVKCEAVISATNFPINGGELLLKGVTYDIVHSTQSGVGDEFIVQKVVLHER